MPHRISPLPNFYRQYGPSRPKLPVMEVASCWTRSSKSFENPDCLLQLHWRCYSFNEFVHFHDDHLLLFLIHIDSSVSQKLATYRPTCRGKWSVPCVFISIGRFPLCAALPRKKRIWYNVSKVSKENFSMELSEGWMYKNMGPLLSSINKRESIRRLICLCLLFPLPLIKNQCSSRSLIIMRQSALLALLQRSQSHLMKRLWHDPLHWKVWTPSRPNPCAVYWCEKWILLNAAIFSGQKDHRTTPWIWIPSHGYWKQTWRTAYRMTKSRNDAQSAALTNFKVAEAWIPSSCFWNSFSIWWWWSYL